MSQGIDFFNQFVEEDPEIAAVMAEAVDHASGTAAATCVLAESLLKVQHVPLPGRGHPAAPRPF